MKFEQGVKNETTNETDVLSNEKKQSCKFDKLTEKILSMDLSKVSMNKFKEVFQKIAIEKPVMYDEEVKSLYLYLVDQKRKQGEDGSGFAKVFQSELFSYMSNSKIDKKTNENTLDRAYRLFYEIAEKFPVEMAPLMQTTNSVDEFVNPDIFFDTYLKIMDSPVLNRYFGGAQFSSLEYNMTYCDTDRYVESLLRKINFTDSNSCEKSSKLMNLSAHLADYTASGSYGKSKNIDKKIIDGLKSKASNSDSIYLLGSKAQYIVERLEKGYPPFVHKRGIFEVAPGKVGCLTEEGFFVGDKTNKDFSELYNQYVSLCEKMDTPPKDLLDEAVRLGLKEITWRQDSSDRFLRDAMHKKLISEMICIDSRYVGKETNSNEIKEFSNLVGTDYRVFLEEELNIKLSDFNIQEQFYFLEYIQGQTNESIKPVKNFVGKYKEFGFQTFLSIEHGGKEMGDKILELGEKLPEDVANKVFAKYSQIINNVNNILEFTKKSFKKEIDTSPELISKIEETLYLKAKQVLDSVYFDINSNKKVNISEIEKSLDRINADTLTTFAIFKQAIKNGEKLPIESIEGAVFSKKEATFISEQQQKEMLDLYEINWKNHPDREFVSSLKGYFQTAFNPEENKSRNQFYTFEKDGHIRAFVRFEEERKGNLYASALNVDEASKSFGLGEAMMDEALIREAQTHILHASCKKDNPSNMRYFEKGFIANGFKQTNNTEEFDLIWDEKENQNIFAKQKNSEELVEMYLKNNFPENIEIRKESNLEDLHANIPQGKSLVRCFQDPLKSGAWYAVYEKININYGVKLGEVE